MARTDNPQQSGEWDDRVKTKAGLPHWEDPAGTPQGADEPIVHDGIVLGED